MPLSPKAVRRGGKLLSLLRPIRAAGSTDAAHSVAILWFGPQHVADIEQNLQVYARPTVLRYFFPAVEDRAGIVNTMVAAGAWPSSGTTYSPGGGNLEALETLDKLLSAGLATCFGLDAEGGRWCFSDTASAALQVAQEVSDPKPMFAVRDGVPLPENTMWELIVRLERSGWLFKPNPKTAHRASVAPFVPSNPEVNKVWYGAEASLCKPYVICLLRHVQLREAGVKMIRHFQTDRRR